VQVWFGGGGEETQFGCASCPYLTSIMRHPLNKNQITLVSQTFADLAKLMFASSVVGFFIPGSSGTVSLLTFLIGAASASGLFMLSIAVLRT
jgi:hypothetical protein